MEATLPARTAPSLPGSPMVWGWLAICIGATLAVSLSWWALLAPGAGNDSFRELVILEGTAEAIAKGYPVSQPSIIDLKPGGTLRIVNQDTTDHTVGWVTVPPGQTGELIAPRGASDNIKFDCTIHPSGALGLSVAQRLPLWQAVLGAVIAGGIMGGIAAGVTAVTRRLDGE